MKVKFVLLNNANIKWSLVSCIHFKTCFRHTNQRMMSTVFLSGSGASLHLPIHKINHVASVMCTSRPNYVFAMCKRSFSISWLNEIALTQSKWFQSFSQSVIVEKSMSSLQYVHDTLHIPWWLSVILSTVLLRVAITFPLAIYQNYIFAKFENLRPEMDELVKELKRETAVAIKMFKWDEKHARIMYNRSARRLWKELIIKENCHPFKASILLWIQIPLWVVLTVSYRNMANMLPRNDTTAQIIFMELCGGGFGWLPNLTDVDHSLILPVIMAISNILIVDVNLINRQFEETKRQRYMGYFFKSVSLILLPIAANVPGCVVLYWTTSSLCGLAQNALLLHPRVRRLCRIPQTPSEKPNPYKRLISLLGNKYIFLKNGEKKT